MDRRSKGYLMVAAAIALVAVGVAVWALFFRDPSPAPAPDIAPPVEDNALPTGEDDGDKLPQAQGGGAVNITYSDQVAVCLETRTVSIRPTPPARTRVWWCVSSWGSWWRRNPALCPQAAPWSPCRCWPM